MKILFACNTRNSRATGMAKIMNYLADNFRKRGHSVDIIFQEDVPTFSFSRRLTDLLFPWFLLGTIRKIWKTTGRHDIVAIHSLEAAPYTFMRQFLKSWPPCVMVSYGSDESRWELEKEEERLGFKKIRLFSKIFYYNLVIRPTRFATRHADHVMVGARTEIDFFEKRYGVPRGKVTFIENGVSQDFFIPHDYHRTPEKLLFFGGWEWRKGTRYLTESFVQLAKEYPKLSLSLVGIGVDPETAKKDFPAELHSRVHVIPRVSEQEAPQIYASHDIFVFPSLFESMALVLPEALAAGMPVVTTRACGMQDIVTDGVNGLLVPPRDTQAIVSQVRKFMTDPSLREKLGKTAQENARALLWEKISDSTLAMYEKTLNS